MLGDPRGAAAQQRACDRIARRLYAAARRAGACPVRQRRGDDRAARPELARYSGHTAAVYRAGKSVGEWILRIVQRKLRDECLNGEIFYSLREAQVVSKCGGSITTPSGRTVR